MEFRNLGRIVGNFVRPSNGELWHQPWGYTNHRKGMPKKTTILNVLLGYHYHYYIIFTREYIYIIGYDSQQILVGSCWVCLKMDSGLNFWRLLNEHQWTSMNNINDTNTHKNIIGNCKWYVWYLIRNPKLDGWWSFCTLRWQRWRDTTIWRHNRLINNYCTLFFAYSETYPGCFSNVPSFWSPALTTYASPKVGAYRVKLLVPAQLFCRWLCK